LGGYNGAGHFADGTEATMANLNKRVPEDAPGDFFVDSTCIDLT
jgi:hypothetical protein